ncbi:MAG: methyltransferase domain-containing protein [Bacillota bacterium]
MHRPVNELVSELPEIYQPIYGHPELSKSVSRICNDRLIYLESICSSFLKWLQRPVRILDLGCAQGYFSLNLARMGASVVGIDNLPENIALAEALAAENPELTVTFKIASIEDVLRQIEPDQFDLVLGLSVFHHLVYQYGVDNVVKLLANTAQNVVAGVFELALHNEPLYWADTQPEDEELLLSSFAFVHELARFSTHLSDISRPLYFASNKCCYFSGELYPFSRWTTESHLLAKGVHQGTRRYYFGEGFLCKLFSLKGELANNNLNEINQEIMTLSSKINGINLPNLIESGVSAREAWLVRSTIPGLPLIEIMEKGQPYDSEKVISDVLEQLAVLESYGLYHNDIRVWNIIVSPDGRAHLIDYGSISSERIDCVWPKDHFLAFWIFVHDVATGIVPRIQPYRQPFISPFNLPDIFRDWAMKVWQHPTNEWSFRLFQELWSKSSRSNSPDARENRAEEKWMQAIESYLDGLGNYIDQNFSAMQRSFKLMQEQINTCLHQENHRLIDILAEQERKISDLLAYAERLNHECKEARESLETANNRIRDLEVSFVRQEMARRELQARAEWLNNELNTAKAKIDELNANAHHWWTVAEGLNRELHGVYTSWSWRLTFPLRLVNWYIKRFPGVIKTILLNIVGLLRMFRRILEVGLMYVRRSTQKVCLKAIILWAGKHVEKSARLRRCILTVLRSFPTIEVRLRQIYLRQRWSLEFNLPVIQHNQVVNTDNYNPGDNVFASFVPQLRGVNADQRTPLEASFYKYRDES